LSDLEESFDRGGEVALIIDCDERKQLTLVGYSVAKEKKFSEDNLRNLFVQDAVERSDIPDSDREKVTNFFLGMYRNQNRDEPWPEVTTLA
jgi:hypothetical protein